MSSALSGSTDCTNHIRRWPSDISGGSVATLPPPTPAGAVGRARPRSAILRRNNSRRCVVEPGAGARGVSHARIPTFPTLRPSVGGRVRCGSRRLLQRVDQFVHGDAAEHARHRNRAARRSGAAACADRAPAASPHPGRSATALRSIDDRIAQSAKSRPARRAPPRRTASRLTSSPSAGRSAGAPALRMAWGFPGFRRTPAAGRSPRRRSAGRRS